MLKGQNGITHHVLSQRKLQHRSADDSRESMLRVNAGQTMKWWAWRQWHVGFAFCPSLGEDAEVEFHLRIWCRPAFSILSRLELPSFDPCVSNLSICTPPASDISWTTAFHRAWRPASKALMALDRRSWHYRTKFPFWMLNIWDTIFFTYNLRIGCFKMLKAMWVGYPISQIPIGSSWISSFGVQFGNPILVALQSVWFVTEISIS